MWVSPSVVPIVGQVTHKFPVPQGAVQVDMHNIGHNISPRNAADMLPDYPWVLPQRSDPPVIPPPLHPPQLRRTTVGFDESPVVIPSPTNLSGRSPNVSSKFLTNSGPEQPPIVNASSYPSLASPMTSGYSNPNGLTTSTYPTSMEAPLVSAFTYPGTPSNGFFVDFDLRRFTPYTTTTTPEFHLFQQGFQLTLMASTGQVALLLTTQNESIWRSFLEDDLQYTELVTDIRNTCEQYGVVESINVPRRAEYQVRAEAIGRACIKFTRPEDASRALRGFLDRPFESCPVSARLLTEEEELAWGVSQRTLHPDLPTVTEEDSVYEDAASLNTLPTPESAKDQGPAKTTAGESNPHSAGEGTSQPEANPSASPLGAVLSSGSGSATFTDPFATPRATVRGPGGD
ncbi:hypothetical protein FRC10_006949 [Ceratobasidium sp. 414]|nr:hypothetical protein FRC10_006949 [Ceratobasidium sp. 414]